MENSWLEIAKLCRVFFSEEDPKKLVDVVLRQSLILLKAERSTAFLYSDSNENKKSSKNLQSLVAMGLDDDSIVVDVKGSLAGYSFSTQQAFVSNDVQNDSRFNPSIDQKTGFNTKSILCVPIGSSVGVLQILNSKNGEFSDDDLEKARILAFFAATALKQVSKINELKEDKQGLTQYQKQMFEIPKDLVSSKNRYLSELCQKLPHLSESDANILIGGESGTGKEVMAHYIHSLSLRSQAPFIAVNCASIPEALFEAELFGVAKGAATGTKERKGKIRLAHEGTLFLDEIGELSLAAQAKLLRVLQDHKVERVGDDVPGRKVDFRLIAATNRNLKEMVENKEFREDLYYRLNVVQVTIPALRERLEDIPSLCESIVDSYRKKHSRYREKRFNENCFDFLKSFDWPGNIRQLQNKIESALILSGDRQEILSKDFGLEAFQDSGSGKGGLSLVSSIPSGNMGRLLEIESFKEAKKEFERTYIGHALDRYKGNKSKTAQMIGLSREALRKIMLHAPATKKAA